MAPGTCPEALHVTDPDHNASGSGEFRTEQKKDVGRGKGSPPSKPRDEKVKQPAATETEASDLILASGGREGAETMMAAVGEAARPSIMSNWDVKDAKILIDYHIADAEKKRVKPGMPFQKLPGTCIDKLDEPI
jgi:hypothetical protein